MTSGNLQAIAPSFNRLVHIASCERLPNGAINPDTYASIGPAYARVEKLEPFLEAERCRDLAIAWEKKGEGEYASDYRARAQLVAR